MHVFRDLAHLMTGGGVLKPSCTSPLATASLSATWLGKGNPAISEICDTPAVTYRYFLNVGRDV
jgi:hypothetical protein